MGELMMEMELFKKEREIETKLSYKRSWCCNASLDYVINDEGLKVKCKKCNDDVDLETLNLRL